MIKANEVRIGNLVSCPEIDRLGIVEHLTANIISIGVLNERRSISSNRTKNGFEGVPLTEEWLLKFGFEKVDKINYRVWQWFAEVVDAHGLLSTKLFSVNENCTNFFMNNNWLSRIEYVHQLQNLYFALTGTELELKK